MGSSCQLYLCSFFDGVKKMADKQLSFGLGRRGSWIRSGMGVPGGKEAKPTGLAGAQERDMDPIEGPVPDRFDHLFGFVTPFRPPVYSNPQARTVEDRCGRGSRCGTYLEDE